MVLFKNGIIGTINGRVGNLVFSKLNGKGFISFRQENIRNRKVYL